MNWFSKLKFGFRLLKIADSPLPSFEYPEGQDYENLSRYQRSGINRVDDQMTEQDAAEQSKKHPDLMYEGSGSYGTAFKHDNNAIIKYTTDSSEYTSAIEIMGMQKTMGRVPGCVKVFDAEELDDGIYAIKMERLEPLNGEEKEIIYVLYRTIRDYLVEMRDSNKQLIKILEHQCNEYGYRMPDLTSPLFKKVFQKYKNMITVLSEQDANVNDSHEDNIGKLPNGDYVMFDLGSLF